MSETDFDLEEVARENARRRVECHDSFGIDSDRDGIVRRLETLLGWARDGRLSSLAAQQVSLNSGGGGMSVGFLAYSVRLPDWLED